VEAGSTACGLHLLQRPFEAIVEVIPGDPARLRTRRTLCPMSDSSRMAFIRGLSPRTDANIMVQARDPSPHGDTRTFNPHLFERNGTVASDGPKNSAVRRYETYSSSPDPSLPRMSFMQKNRKIAKIIVWLSSDLLIGTHTW
jgi:hypothetical protein